MVQSWSFKGKNESTEDAKKRKARERQALHRSRKSTVEKEVANSADRQSMDNTKKSGETGEEQGKLPNCLTRLP